MPGVCRICGSIYYNGISEGGLCIKCAKKVYNASRIVPGQIRRRSWHDVESAMIRKSRKASKSQKNYQRKKEWNKELKGCVDRNA